MTSGAAIICQDGGWLFAREKEGPQKKRSTFRFKSTLPSPSAPAMTVRATKSLYDKSSVAVKVLRDVFVI